MKKEELQKEVEALENVQESLIGEDKSTRREFAKAFGWAKEKSYHSELTNYRTPTWEEIFTKLGKLLACRTFHDHEDTLRNMQCQIDILYKEKNDEPI